MMVMIRPMDARWKMTKLTRYPLLPIRPGSAVTYVEKTGMVYFLDRDRGALSSMQLVPTPPLVPLPFQEHPRDSNDEPHLSP